MLWAVKFPELTASPVKLPWPGPTCEGICAPGSEADVVVGVRVDDAEGVGVGVGVADAVALWLYEFDMCKVGL